MKIVIDNLHQDLVFEIDPAAGKNIKGGDFIDSNVSVVAVSDNAQSQGSAGVLGFGSNLSASLTVNAQTGNNFSQNKSFSGVSQL
jgi:hypothetical protein